MSQQKKIICLLITLAAIFYAPYISVYFANGGIPPNFFHFPATDPTPKPASSLLTTVLFALVFIAAMLLLIFPRLFGFKKSNPIKSEKKMNGIKLPSWFWIGFVLWAVIIVMFACKFSQPKWLLDWALLPLWWGFILMMDGWVYQRNNRKSLISKAPNELIAMGVLSISGWLIFEYFNFFIKLNWYYPKANLLKHADFLLYAVTGSSAFIPMCFEWYHLLQTFPSIKAKYKLGPKVHFSKILRIVLLALAFAGLMISPFHTSGMFYIMWLSPLTILSIALGMLDIWTPFKSIKEKGDWSSLLIFAPTFLIQGVLVEYWNYLSAIHYSNGSTWSANPGFWSYCIPYVNQWHLFQMPLLGYLGYIPFSIYCWIWFIAISYLMNISTSHSLSDDYL